MIDKAYGFKSWDQRQWVKLGNLLRENYTLNGSAPLGALAVKALHIVQPLLVRMHTRSLLEGCHDSSDQGQTLENVAAALILGCEAEFESHEAMIKKMKLLIKKNRLRRRIGSEVYSDTAGYSQIPLHVGAERIGGDSVLPSFILRESQQPTDTCAESGKPERESKLYVTTHASQWEEALSHVKVRMIVGRSALKAAVNWGLECSGEIVGLDDVRQRQDMNTAVAEVRRRLRIWASSSKAR